MWYSDGLSARYLFLSGDNMADSMNTAQNAPHY